uniref:Lipocalin/cytosolic fatty-acid binding domain-containing protein n=2 Tax=Oryctolagus cuniculus TaxID=9986 RepID=G1U400_RABIT
MKLLWLCLGLILICAPKRGDAHSHSEVSQISGEWYSVLLASDHREKIEENGSMRVFVEYIHVWKNSSLSFKFHTPVNGKCTELFLTCDPTEDNHVYTVEYDGHNVFSILDMVPDDYIIFHLINHNNGESFQLMELYGRGLDVRSDIREKFVQLCQERGIVEENILDLTKVDRCLYARDGGAA